MPQLVIDPTQWLTSNANVVALGEDLHATFNPATAWEDVQDKQAWYDLAESAVDLVLAQIHTLFPDGPVNSRVYNPIPGDCTCTWLKVGVVDGGMLMAVDTECPVHQGY